MRFGPLSSPIRDDSGTNLYRDSSSTPTPHPTCSPLYALLNRIEYVVRGHYLYALPPCFTQGTGLPIESFSLLYGLTCQIKMNKFTIKIDMVWFTAHFHDFVIINLHCLPSANSWSSGTCKACFSTGRFIFNLKITLKFKRLLYRTEP